MQLNPTHCLRLWDGRTGKYVHAFRGHVGRALPEPIGQMNQFFFFTSPSVEE